MLNIDFFKTLLNGIKSRFTSQQKQIDAQQKQIDGLTAEQNELRSRPSETVLYTPQDLTDEEKQRARENIGVQNLSKLYFVHFRYYGGRSYGCDESAADIIANLPNCSDEKLMVGVYIDSPDRGATSNQFLYLDYYEIINDNYKIKFTSFRTLERKYEYFGSAGFDVTINLVDSVFTVEKVIRYNTDVIYQMTKSSTDGKYHLYLNGSEVTPAEIMLDSNKNCYIDYDDNRYFCTMYPNRQSPEFFAINSKYEISKIVLDRQLNSIEVTDFESIGGTDLSLAITGAAAGQIAKITAVDENGVPTAWTPVDMPTGGATDEQLSAAVSGWLDDHPEATTTVQDGSITDAKLSDGLYERVMGDARHKLTEVEVAPVPKDKTGDDWVKANFDGTAYNVVTSFFVPLTKTPRYIKVVNKTGDVTIKLGLGYTVFRFANGADETADGFATSNGNRNLQFFRNLSVAPGDTLLYDLQEYGRKGCEYFQFVIAGKNFAGKYTDAQFSEKLKELVDVYYVYDTYVPQYNLPDDSGELLTDLPVRYAAQGANDTKATRGYAIVPYYPDTTYNIRGGYYANVLINSLNVVYLLDDAIFNGRDKGIDFSSGDCGHVPLIGRGTLKTTQYDTSVNAGKNNAYAWAFHKTPPATELIGPKYIAFELLNIQQDENEDKGETYYKSVFDGINEKGPQNTYITRFDKQIARSLYAQIAIPNPEYHDDGSKYYAMLSHGSRSPLVNATWTLFGDSLTDDYGGHDMTGNYFATKIAREFNMSFDNRAKSGSNIYRGGSGNYVSVSGMIELDAFVAEIDAGTIDQPGYITIAFGTNSFAAQIGTNADTSETDTSVYGATKRFIEKLREKCPKSVFGFVLSPKQNWGTNDPNNVRAVDAARTAIKTVCEEYGVPYVDMSTQSGITTSMLPDGIHISNVQSQNLYYHAMRRFVMGL